MRATVIISFYNNIAWLKLVLAGLNRQSFKDFELIISDDGSKPEVVAEIASIKNNYKFPIKHIWHHDDGWQKNIILNQSIQNSETDYLIFIDGDCIPHRHFIKEHYKNRSNGMLLAGRRVNLSKKVSLRATVQKIEKGYLEWVGLFWSFLAQLRNKSSHTENGLYAYPKFIRSFINKKDKGVLGSNFSIHRTDLLAVNGFDERYKLPAVGEDTDLELRLRNKGIKIKAVKHLAIQYHLHHKILPRDPKNLEILNDNKKHNISYTPYGIIKDSNPKKMPQNNIRE